MNLRFTFIFVFLGSTLLPLSCLFAQDMAKLYQDLPFEMPLVERPPIPLQSVDISEFGGVGNGITLNSKAFERAISHLAELGGGKLVVPQGVWLTGPIELDNNIELHVSENAILVFSQDKSLYPIVHTLFEGSETYRCKPQLLAVGKRNVAVTGKGIIDGAGDIWRLGRKSEMPPMIWEDCLKRGGILSEDGELWYPTESYYRGAKDAIQNIVPWAKTMADFESIRDFLRPVMVNFRSCEGVLLEGITFQNSPCWNVHLSLCSNVIINDIAVRCPWYAKNGDGIDIESCTNVILTNSWFDVGDDAICIKSGKDNEGRKRGIPASNIIVDNCICYHGHGGFVVGSEMSGGAKNISVSNCRFSGTDVGLRFKSKRGRGGVVENIYIKDIMMNDIVTEALLFDLFYGKSSLQESYAKGEEYDVADMIPMPLNEGTPQFKDIYITRVTCHGAKRAMYFNGLPEMNIKNIRIEDSSIYSETGIEIYESTDVQLYNVSVTHQIGPVLILNNVQCLDIHNLRCPVDRTEMLKVTGSRNEKIKISSSSITRARALISEKADRTVIFK